MSRVCVAVLTLVIGCASKDRDMSHDYDGGLPPPPVVGSVVARVTLTPLGRTTSGPAAGVAVFGHAFRPGDVPGGHSLGIREGDTTVAVQLDAVARHADGSLRFAVLSIPRPHADGTPEVLELLLAEGAAPSSAPIPRMTARSMSPDTVVTIRIAGKRYRASLRTALESADSATWLAGPYVTEWQAKAAFLDDANVPHPHLVARFGLRLLGAEAKPRVEVVIENTWAYESAPQGFVCDLDVTIDGDDVEHTDALTHYAQARLRRVYWPSGSGDFHARLDIDYLIATGAVPSYQPGLVPSASALSSLRSAWAQVKDEPMGIGLATDYMPQTGGRWDIGPLPGWTAIYLLSGDEDARAATLGTGDAAGTWDIHYRDRVTDLPVSLEDHPRMTLLGNPGDTIDPDTGLSDAFPDCVASCSTPNVPDSAHQPSLAFVPYLLTGERYYLEELHFWANWNMLQANPAYRQLEKGLLKWDQVRGQGWSLRTLADAAWVTPDAHPMRSYFETRLAHNIDWYTNHYVHAASPLAVHYLEVGTPEVSPWMDDFFTWSIGHVVALGFTDARAMLGWKATFPVDRMTDATYCYIFAAPYRLIVRSSETGPFYTSLAQMYAPTLAFADRSAALSTDCGSQAMATALSLEVGEMTGYAGEPDGYPSNMQPALAVAVDANVPHAREAWERFANAPVRPDYSNAPQFAIVPRP